MDREAQHFIVRLSIRALSVFVRELSLLYRVCGMRPTLIMVTEQYWVTLTIPGTCATTPQRS